MIPEFQRHLSPAQQAVMEQATFTAGTVFPNLSYLDVFIPKAEGAPPCSFLAFKFWEPIAFNKTRIPRTSCSTRRLRRTSARSRWRPRCKT
jgi:PAH dioxygenase large subunit